MRFDEYMDFMGPSEWESLCVAYLMFEEEFVPTGLLVGRTLPTVDVVGRRKSDAARIIAQCKRHEYPIEIGDDFATVSNALNSHDRAFYFAFGGVAGAVPANVVVLTRDDLLSWGRYTDGPTISQPTGVILVACRTSCVGFLEVDNGPTGIPVRASNSGRG